MKLNRVQERNSNAALNLAREYYGDNNLKKRDVRPTELVDFEGIARHRNVNIMLYEPKKDWGKDAGSMWRLAYNKAQHKNNLPTINMGLLGGHCFYIKKWMCFVSNGNVKALGKYLRKMRIWWDRISCFPKEVANAMREADKDLL